VEIARLQDVQHAGPEGFVARPFLEGNQSNVRVIRLASGQALPPHRHGESDLMLYVSDGQGELETTTGKVPFTAG
jgi:quercetin dioxygenase-like cupin family protein